MIKIVFSNLLFMFAFLPANIILYFLARNFKVKNIILIIFSLVFYSWGEPVCVALLIFSSFIGYIFAMQIHKSETEQQKKMYLIISLIINIGLLGIFKYTGFFVNNLNALLPIDLPVPNISLPIGISFYTFQIVSYVADVYCNRVKAQESFPKFLMYVSLYPQLIAGPIIRYIDIEKEIDNREVNISNISQGINRFIIGLAKKVIIANTAATLVSTFLDGEIATLGVLDAWFGLLMFTVQIYFDFSGYSDMAIGLGKIFGFTYCENFNYPYISKSATEFWRRWHMSLGSFFRDYVYIPLGGNRKRQLLNIFVVWFLTGFWHGASYNFILWGLYFFLLISIEKAGLLKFLNNNKFISHIYAIFFILIGWVLFAVVDLAQIKLLFKQMFSFNIGNEWIYYLRNYAIVFIIAIIFSTSFPKKLYKKFIKNDVIDTVIILMIFLVSIAYLVDSSYNPFLYFRF